MLIDPTSLPAPSGQTILIVEDEFAVANDLRQILEKAGYHVSGIAFNVDKALEINRRERPDLVLLDIHLKGPRTGISLAHLLTEDGIPFVYVSANNSKTILEEAKNTQPYGFVVKPFRERDVLAALEAARCQLELRIREQQAPQFAQ